MSNEEIIEDFIDEMRDMVLTKETLEIVNALKDILLERKQDKKRIEELEEINKKYIVQLTDEQYRNLVDIIRKEVKKEFEQKVKDKIEEYKIKRNKYESETQEIFANNYYQRKTLELTNRICALEELLEDK